MPRVRKTLILEMCLLLYVFASLATGRNTRVINNLEIDFLLSDEWEPRERLLQDSLEGGMRSLTLDERAPRMLSVFSTPKSGSFLANLRNWHWQKFEKTQPRESRRCLCTLQSRSALAGYGQL